ncbi:hypothetical protein FOPG_18686 [Fusarium oxysporum f. sp. conglutinans race 2 54008]|uniref:Uncharacterized protein n=1 Tax=Fusarium oxysporum f. sp. conglutinans race 2 54008 TaxID=1089457 RepID=X0GYU0_FUSOX|nr:hypothetical protein FOPG_18686 [Fusarium oxysporum f. sp. conglutinans race 2 54008]
MPLAMWLGLSVLLAFIAIAIGFTAKFLVDGSKIGLDPTSLDFALYKNTRFKECQTTTPPPDAATCQDVRANLLDLSSANYREFTDQGVSVVIQPYVVSQNRTKTPGSHRPITYDWCQAVSCLGDSFKVIPSTLRGSAFADTPLTVWCSVAITLFTILWDFRQRKVANSKTKWACKGLREVAWYDWIFHAYDLCSAVWWWVSFARFITNPAYNTAPTSIGWVVPWKYAILIYHHPYSCALTTKHRYRGLSWMLNTLAFLQWIATIYVLHVMWPSITKSRTPFQAYDCASSYMDEAPGVSPCPTQELCSKSWLLTHPGFIYRHEVLGSGMYVLIFFVIFTLAAIFTFGMVLIALSFKGFSNNKPLSTALIKEAWRESKVSPTVSLAVAAWSGGIIFGSMFTADLIRWNNHGQEAPLTFYPACNAVHIALSSWKFYLDVDAYQRVFRIVKMWFNA